MACVLFILMWVILCTCWYLFRLLDMQPEAFRFEKSFEHSPKPPKPPFYTLFNDFNVNNRHLEQQMSKINFDRCYPTYKNALNSLVQSILLETFYND